MKIAIIGANGKAGQAILKEAMKRDLDVTGIIRKAQKLPVPTIIKDIMSLTKDDLAEFDVVVSAFGTWDPATFNLHKDTLVHLGELLQNTKTRLMVVGGAGSLYVNPQHSKSLYELPDFPKEYYPLSAAMAKGLAALRTVEKLDWTYISPAAEFIADGEVKNSYVLAGEEFTVNEQGASQISYADYAKGFVDEILNHKYPQQRISLRW